MREHHTDIQIKASYLTLNELSSRTRRLWVVFHGQGMLARYFSKKFETLNPDENFIIAPQGLSKYYLNGFTGRVGASWMTKEDRLTEIDNQQRYVRAVLKAEGVWEFEGEIILFGFSQGAATASRFGAFSGLLFHKLVLWSGMFPEDMKPEEVSHWSPDLEIISFMGTKDPFLKEGLIEQQRQVIKTITGKEVELHTFDGEHLVVPELLVKI